MYRSTGDIGERFTSIRDIASSQFDLLRYSAPGCYNDLDMLVCGMDGVGNVGHPGLCGDTEYKTHFALWCMASSPLMIGSDLRRLRPETLELLKNPDLLRIDADPECRAPIVIKTSGDLMPIFFKHLSNHEFALGFFNLADDTGRSYLCPWDIGFPTDSGFSFNLREIFTGEEIHGAPDYMSFTIEPHDCKIFIGNYAAD